MSAVIRALASGLFVLVLAFPGAALASAVIQSLQGTVQVGSSAEAMIAARESQRLAAGTTVRTGTDAQAVLRFDDGQRVVLNENTEFRIVDYMYVEAQPEADRSVFDLLRGAARFVTGILGQRSKSAWQVRVPQATIGLRGTDFMLAVGNTLYTSVTSGSIAVSNAYSTVVFGAGTVGSVTSSAALATTIPASSLPASVSGAFGQMSSVVVGSTGAGVAGGAASGAAGSATGAAAGGVGVGTAAAIGAAAAAAAAAGGGDGSTTTQHSTTTHH